MKGRILITVQDCIKTAEKTAIYTFLNKTEIQFMELITAGGGGNQYPLLAQHGICTQRFVTHARNQGLKNYG